MTETSRNISMFISFSFMAMSGFLVKGYKLDLMFDWILISFLYTIPSGARSHCVLDSAMLQCVNFAEKILQIVQNSHQI